jgi:hypothetical protein
LCVFFFLALISYLIFSTPKPKGKCFLWVVCLPPQLATKLLNVKVCRVIATIQKWNEVDSTTQQQTIKTVNQVLQAQSFTSVSLWSADSHLLSLSLVWPKAISKAIYRVLVAKFVWGLENVLPSDNESKVSTEDVDEFVLLNERICSPITHTHTHTHMYMHRNSLVALIQIILFIKMLKVLFSPKSNTLWTKTMNYMKDSILDIKSSKLNLLIIR